MKGFIFFACAIWIAIFFALAGLSTGAERGIRVKRINDLSHESGKLGEYNLHFARLEHRFPNYVEPRF
jgi:hypothetical protein